MSSKGLESQLTKGRKRRRGEGEGRKTDLFAVRLLDFVVSSVRADTEDIAGVRGARGLVKVHLLVFTEGSSKVRQS